MIELMGQYLLILWKINASIKHFIYNILFRDELGNNAVDSMFLSFQIIYPCLINITNKCVVILKPYLHNMMS